MLMKMDSNLTDPEMDAALQLIQLSGDSDTKSGGGGANARGDHHPLVGIIKGQQQEGEEESVGDNNSFGEICSSTIMVDDGRREEDSIAKACSSKRKRKFRTVVDLYDQTKPLLTRRRKLAAGKKLRRF